MDDRKELSDRQVFELIDMFSELKVQSLIFIGGEPTLKSGLSTYVAAAKSKGIREVTVVTNGRLLSNPRFVDQLRGSGLDIFSVSIHSINKEIHDTISGVPSWSQTYEGILNILEAGGRCSVNIVAGKENYSTVTASAKHFVSLGVEAVVVTCALTSYDKSVDEFDDEFSLDPKDFAILIEELSETDPRIQIMHELPLCLIPRNTLVKLLQNGKLGFGCHVGTGQGMCVNNDGHLVACNTMNFLDLGNLFGEDNHLVRNTGDILKHWSVIQEDLRLEIDVYRSEHCKKCAFWPQCKAGCPVVWGTREPSDYINSTLSNLSLERLGLTTKVAREGGDM